MSSQGIKIQAWIILILCAIKILDCSHCYLVCFSLSAKSSLDNM